MATNKRKDAAALFELIDKSTLKVPKGAGSLKIPSWWSSKTNPPPQASQPGAAVPQSASRVGPGIEDETGGAPEAATGKAAGTGGVNGAAEHQTTQPRLFQPPPANAAAGVSPSIRPPGPGGTERHLPAERGAGSETARVAEANSLKEQAGAAAAAAVADQREEAAQEGHYAGLGSGKRVFAPQTMSQGMARRDWNSSSKLRLARTPGWVLGAAAIGAALLLLLIVWALWPHKAVEKAASSTGGPSAAGGSTYTSRSNGASQGSAANNSAAKQAVQQTANNVPPAKGQVYKGGTVNRSPELYYIWIASTPTEKIAQKNAEFLAAHGIDVSIEILELKKTKSFLYVIISVNGFSTNEAAEPYRAKIVQIGHLTDDYRKTKRAWDDAVPRKVSAPSAK
jgi:hypothetical protein